MFNIIVTIRAISWQRCGSYNDSDCACDDCCNEEKLFCSRKSNLWSDVRKGTMRVFHNQYLKHCLKKIYLSWTDKAQVVTLFTGSIIGRVPAPGSGRF